MRQESDCRIVSVLGDYLSSECTLLSLPILKRTEEDEEGIERLSASTRLPSYSKDCRCSLLLQGCETLELLWRPLPQDKGGGSRESSWASATVAGRFVKIGNILQVKSLQLLTGDFSALYGRWKSPPKTLVAHRLLFSRHHLVGRVSVVLFQIQCPHKGRIVLFR